MKTPPLLLGASLLFWGWQTGQIILAVIMASVLEGARFVSFRWELSDPDFNRISDFCTVILVGMVAYLLLTQRSFALILVFLKWLPIAFLPLMIAQIYSTSDSIDISALFLMVRKKKGMEDERPGTKINLTYPYFVHCILSASAANVRNMWFYAGLLLLSAWALWTIRPKRNSPILWIFLISLIAAAGYVGHVGLHGLQKILDKKGVEWFYGFNAQDTDPFQRATAIGDIGNLKLSGRIVFKVKPDNNDRTPMLLGQSSYNAYRSTRWFAAGSKYQKVRSDSDKTTWNFYPEPGKGKLITVMSPLRKGRGILTLPNGTYRISDLPVSNMEQSNTNAVKVENGPGFVNYRVRFSPKTFFDQPPNENDLTIPKRERRAIIGIIEQLKLKSLPQKEILQSINAFFENNFKYSLVLTTKGSGTTPLSEFLLKSRTGHCEYFATAAVLLLRASGIPARYTSGYAVHEFSPMERKFVVRARHAHAWTRVYLDGVWQDFDPTPASWVGIEEDTASIWESFQSIWSFLTFKFSEWRWQEREKGLARYWVWLLIPLMLIIVRRLYVRKWVKQVKIDPEEKDPTEHKIGVDSKFYEIEKRLIELGFPRYPYETFSSWIKRIEKIESSAISIGPLHAVLVLHYRYRYDPHGISPAEKSTLESGVSSWLENHKMNRGL